MPATMDPFLRAYTGTPYTGDESMTSVVGLPRKRNVNPLDESDDASVSSGRRTSIASDRKSSLGSDSLWGDARRLSEAGVRRTSDSSVVLTEDTDSFIIGDRVWVGGNKPGKIAYIGETQFAPGEWAGVVLDEPIGKNDGSVSNVRYFQCDPKRGIFSRLTRLTRVPLSLPDGGGGGGGGDNTTSLLPQSLHQSHSHHSQLSTPAPVSRPPSVASGRELKVGDRVIVMSSTGSKTGMLRYIGQTEFAPGEWCGVECDDKIGKNDGSVQGVRYFTCEPMYGLFAPVAKVSLSPSPHRRPSCAMHPPGPARQNTKDSITSTASSRVSAARKMSRPGTPSKAGSVTNSTEVGNLMSVNKAAAAVLRDKEQYIEQLLKERDLERMAVTRAAGQAEEAERQVDMLKQELRQLKEVTDAHRAELEHQIAELTREKIDINNLLEDEHIKLEDIHFRFEEEKMTRIEVESNARELKEQVAQLEVVLAEETKRGEQLELESNRLFEAEESLEKLRAVIEEKEAELKLAGESTGTQVQLLKAEVESLNKNNQEITNHLKEEQTLKSELAKVVEESKHLLSTKETELKRYQSQSEQLSLELKNLNTNLKEAEHKYETSEIQCKKLTSEIDSLNLQFTSNKEDLTNEIKKLTENGKKLQDDLNSKSTDISVLNVNISQLENKLKCKEEESIKLKEENDAYILSLNKDISELKNEITTKSLEFENNEEVLKMEIVDLKQALMQVKDNLHEAEEKVKNSVQGSNKQLSDLENKLLERDKNLLIQKQEFESKEQELTNQIESKSQTILSLKKENENAVSKNEDLIKDIEKFKLIAGNNEEKCLELSKCIEAQNHTIATREEEINKNKTTIEEINKTVAELTIEVGDSKRHRQDLEEKCAQVLEQKEKLAQQLSELMNTSSDSSDQLTRLNDALRAKEKECLALQEAAAEFRRQSESGLQKVQQDHQSALQKSKEDIESLQRRFDESLQSKEKECEHFTIKVNKLNETIDELNKKLEEVKTTEKNTLMKLQQVEEIRDELEERLGKESGAVKKLSADLQKNEQSLLALEADQKDKISCLERERDELTALIKISKNNEERTKLELEDKLKTEKSMIESSVKSHLEFDKKILEFEEKIAVLNKKLEASKAEETKSLNIAYDKDLEIAQLQQNITSLKLDNERLTSEVCVRENKIKSVSDELETAKLSLLSTTGKTEEMALQLQQRLTSLSKDKTQLEEVLAQKETLLTRLQSDVESLNEKAKQVPVLEDKYQSVANSLEAMKTAKEEAEKKSLSFETELVSRQKDFEKESLKLKEENANLLALLSSNEGNLKELTQSQSNEKSLREEISKKENEIDQLKSALCNSSEISVDKLKHIEQLQGEILLLKEDKYSLVEELEKSSKDSIKMEALTVQLKKLEAEIAEGKEMYKRNEQALQKQLDALSNENKELKNKLLNESIQSKRIPIVSTNNNSTDDIDPGMHIEFLNSIIGDLQRKTEAQAAEIQLYQSGAAPSTTRVMREVAPRMFCDICDMFDLHETEDCPRQATDSPPPQPPKSRQPRVDRPYCEACEMFGHETADCDPETF